MHAAIIGAVDICLGCHIVARYGARSVRPSEVVLDSFDKMWESRDPVGVCEAEKLFTCQFNKRCKLGVIAKPLPSIPHRFINGCL
jgi:hypothetical protein